MSAVSEIIVREYFELHGFLVKQQRKYLARTQREDEEIDFLVFNPKPVNLAGALPGVLAPDDLPRIKCAIVAVKGWHTDTFRPSLIKLNEVDLFRFVDPKVFSQATRAFGEVGPITKILIVPELPPVEEARGQSLELLKANGVDAVIEFHTMLRDLIDGVEIHRNYQKSDLLQILRILKNYELFREPQLDLFKTRQRKPKKAKAIPVAPPPTAGD